MTPEGQAYDQYLAYAGEAILRELEAVGPEGLNWPLGLPETNTMFASAFHASMSVRSWLVVRAAGQTIERDRDAEFQARGGLEQLRDHWAETFAMGRKALDGFREEDYRSPRHLVFLSSGEERAGTVRDCVLHAIEHVNIHLGHIQIARQLWENRNLSASPSPSGGGYSASPSPSGEGYSASPSPSGRG